MPVASDSPSRWGRIDEGGEVYLRTEHGERHIGSWQAGDAAEGLLHFARRFDDIRTEAELLYSRLIGGAADPKQTRSSATQLRDSLADASVIGDVDALTARLDEVLTLAADAAEHAKQAKEQARAAGTARKEALATEAEQIGADATQWKVAGDRLRGILDEWKGIRGVDRKTDDVLWKRFSKARENFNRRRGAHFAELDKQRASARERKTELVEAAETLSDSTDWGPTAARYKDMMADWKAAGRAPKDVDDALWARFRAAQDAFFGQRSAVLAERDSEFTENARQKEQLLAQAAKIDPEAGLDAARNQLRSIQERWEGVGKVPRERIRDLEAKFKAVEERVRSAEQSQWRRRDPEAQARAAQFRERAEAFQEQARKARAAGDDRRARKAEEQAAQWREWLAAAEEAVASR